MALVGEGADFARFVAGVDAGFDVGSGGGQGFLTKDVVAGLEGFDHLFTVEGVGAGDDNGVGSTGEDVVEGFEDRGVHEVRKSSLKPSDLLGFWVVKTND